MKISSKNFNDGGPIDSQQAFCRKDPETHVTFSDNLSPQLSWEGEPAGTKSFVLLCHDPDVPGEGTDVNQEGKVLAADMPRVDFFHWVLVDLPADSTGIAEGVDSRGVTEGGKDAEPGPHGARRGTNDYTNWFGSDETMGGNYFGYDGPCPPWNDSIAHHYVFTLYALDLETCPVKGVFDGHAVRAAIQGHVLAEASITGTYSLNPDLG